MAEEFHGSVCGGNWWNPSRNRFNPTPCTYDVGSSFGWLYDDGEPAVTAIKAGRSLSGDSGGGSVASDSSTVIQDPTGNGHVSAVASTLETMRINLSSSTDAWNQGFLDNNPQIKQTFFEDSLVNDFRQMNQPFPDQHPSADSLVTSFPVYSAYNSSLLQMLFDTDFDQPLQSSNLPNNRAWNHSNYPSPTPNYPNLSENLPKLTETPHMLENPNSFPKKQPGYNRLQFSNYNNTPFWNASAAVRPSAEPKFRPPSLPATTKLNSANSNTKRQNKEVTTSASIAKKISNEAPQNKRTRVENPSPLPAFKVRKEKMGDRITALQQLVSPFGKTDTASVLQEAIEYIKFLHDQVNALSAPYLKNGAAPPLQHQQVGGDRKTVDKKGVVNKDLRSRGLCLVPLSSTFPVASETASDFWTPNFGGGFR